MVERDASMSSKPARDTNCESDVSAAEIIAAGATYSSSLFHRIGSSAALAFMLAVLMVLTATLTQINSNNSILTALPAALEPSVGGAALILLVPLSISLQVLVRLPRDPESTERAEAIARRQFWGTVAGLSTVASLFVAISTIMYAFVEGQQDQRINFVDLLGVPLGAFLMALLTADAAAITDLEARRRDLVSERVAQNIQQVMLGIRRIQGKPPSHPIRQIVWSAVVFGGLSFLGGTWLAHVLLGNVTATISWGVMSLVLVSYSFLMVGQIVRDAVLGKVLDTLFPVLLTGLVLVAVTLSGVSVGVALRDGDDLDSFYTAVGYGLSVTLPALSMVLGIALVPLGKHSMSSLGVLTRLLLGARLKRLRNFQPEDTKRQPWRAYAWTAIALSLVPPAAFAMTAIAYWHRRGPKQQFLKDEHLSQGDGDKVQTASVTAEVEELGKVETSLGTGSGKQAALMNGEGRLGQGAQNGRNAKGQLMTWAWIIPAAFLLFEILLLVFLPYYGARLGWFTSISVGPSGGLV